MKNSFSSLELIASIIISSIIIVYSMLFIKESIFSNTNNQQMEILKLDLLSTKALGDSAEDSITLKKSTISEISDFSPPFLFTQPNIFSKSHHGH